jgi:hypothetical protein
MATSKRALIIRSVLAVLALLVLVFITAAVAGYLQESGVDLDVGKVAFWVLTPFAVVVMGGAIWLGARWMGAIDEAAREAHKAAWYWGGSSGMAVGGVLMILSSLPGAEALAIPTWLHGRTDPAAYATTGAFMLMSLMVAGYAICWAWWWLARR